MIAAAAAGSLLLASCKGLEALGPPPKPGATVDTLERAIAAEEQLARTYRVALTALAGQPRTAEVLSDVLADHEAHLLRLRARLIVPPGPASAGPGVSPGPGQGSVSPPPAAGGAGTGGRSPGTPQTSPREIIAGLVTAENAAAARLIGQLLTMPPAVAQLMASIGASEAGHAALLSRPGLA
jgi:hypothetical protein